MTAAGPWTLSEKSSFWESSACSGSVSGQQLTSLSHFSGHSPFLAWSAAHFIPFDYILIFSLCPVTAVKTAIHGGCLAFPPLVVFPRSGPNLCVLSKVAEILTFLTLFTLWLYVGKVFQLAAVLHLMGKNSAVWQQPVRSLTLGWDHSANEDIESQHSTSNGDYPDAPPDPNNSRASNPEIPVPVQAPAPTINVRPNWTPRGFRGSVARSSQPTAPPSYRDLSL